MNNVNPMQMISMLRSNNPQQVARQIIQQNFAGDPVMQNLLQMAESGNQQGIQQFAKQFFSSHGTNLETEMNNLMSALKNS